MPPAAPASLDRASIFSTGPYSQRKRMLGLGFPRDDAPEPTDRHGDPQQSGRPGGAGQQDDGQQGALQ